ncbi:MAG TPA: efflux RND transporter periplasmic adaptor subunit [Longimicrobiales bacterium]|nr:efflux RND transporter periplasmic adaptor subunit [Longimicrobiales bacterium]
MNRIVIVTGAALALAACGADTPEHQARDLDPVAVTVSQSWTASSPVAHPARVVPLQEAEVATRMAGTIGRVAVNVGDRVGQGDLIASLDANDVNARIAAARAQLELAQRTFNRVQNLARDGAASAQELDQAQAQLSAAEAMVREAEAQGAYVQIRAPFAGVVTARMADAGDLASPGFPLVRMSGAGVKIVAELPAELAGQVAQGDTVLLDTDAGAREGTVSAVSPALSQGSRRFQVEVAPATSQGLVPGAFARLRLADAAGETRWIPADAVFRSGQLTGVYTVEDQVLHLRWIRLGRTRGDAVEVLAGPPGQMTVVRSPGRELQDGQPVSSASPAPTTPAPGQEA